MKLKLFLLSLCCIAVSCASASAATVAYWRFEATAGSMMATDNAKTSLGTVGTYGYDFSGNGNSLYAYTLSGTRDMVYSSNVSSTTVTKTGSANTSSLQNTSLISSSETVSSLTSPTGTDIQTITPSAWTIEASIYDYNTTYTSNQTFVGRDTSSGLAALYFQILSTGVLRIEFTDVAGTTYYLSDTTGTLSSLTWYNVAAVSDGSTLKLYRQVSGASSYTLVNSLSLTSTNTALKSGGSSYSWSVGRGMWAGAITDYFLGNIDEVRISNTALSTSEFLYSSASSVAVPEPAALILLSFSGGIGLIIRWIRKKKT